PADEELLHRTTRLEQPPAPPVAPPGGHPPVHPQRRGWPLPRRWVLAAAAALLAVLAGTGVWYINSGQFTSVPAVLDMTEAKAGDELDKAGLGVRTRQAFSDTVERGHVISTDPKPGERIRNTGKVTITISRGPQRSEVPNVAGMPFDDAKRKIEEQGLAVGDVGRQFSGETAKDSVLSTEPGPGTQLRPGSTVALVVSKGRPLNVPDVTGLSVADATNALRGAGLQVKVADTEVFSPRDKGTVAEQSPARGARAAEGDTVTVTVSKGKEMVIVPDVTNRSEADAKRTLAAAGFQVKVDRPFLFAKDSVESQSVRGGEQAAKGETIVIRLKSGL
ncbi:PASTA domain-containing protein, partial [Streptomyces sp. SCA3-4]|uniref:Stk1 family PASTA domain-containing Ser/Thr kinase n=1 Tax=Streptomyces sichuanensis TaxID=2871810 RepID=UPI001CE28F96